MDRQDALIPTVDGTRLHAWVYRPTGAGPFPCIVLSHGFSALKSMGLAAYAERFVAAGLACVVYDHRNYGASEGQPRHESDPWQQVRDMRDVVGYAETLGGIDPARIGLWGTSYSGGHVLAVGALDYRVRCVVSQVPLVSGSETLRHWVPPAAWQKMQERFAADRRARAAGEPPRMTTSSREGDETWEWQQAVDTAGVYANETTQRSLDLLDEYEPRDFIARVAPRPLLMIVADSDTQTPVAGQIAAFERAGEPKRLLRLPGRHYDPYIGLLEQSAGAAKDWFVEHLEVRSTA